MPRTNYQRGADKERRLLNKWKEKEGVIGFRSAGSHSPIDLCIIDKVERRIHFLQAKPKSFSDNKRQKLLDELDFLKGEWIVDFDVV